MVKNREITVTTTAVMKTCQNQTYPNIVPPKSASIFENFIEVLNKICEQNDIIGCNLKQQKVQINFKEDIRITDFVRLSSGASESGAEVFTFFGLANINCVIIAGAVLKGGWLKIGANLLYRVHGKMWTAPVS